MYNLTQMIKHADSIGVTVYLVPIENENAKSKQGIHLLMPSETEFLNALSVAERDGFEAIYIHNQF